MRVEADDADVAARALGYRFGDRVGPTGRILSDNDWDGAHVQNVIDSCLDGRLSSEDVLRGWLVKHLWRNVRIPIIHDAQVLENVEVHVLQVSRGISDRLLADSFRCRDPIALRHAGILFPTGHIGRAKNHRVSPFELGRGSGERQPHERGDAGADEREIPGSHHDRISDRGPIRI